MEELIKKWEDKLNEDKREDVYYTRELLNEMISDFKEILKLFDDKLKEAYTDGFSDSRFDFDAENYY